MSLVVLFKKIKRRFYFECKRKCSSLFDKLISTHRSDPQIVTEGLNDVFNLNCVNFSIYGNSPYWLKFQNIELRKIGYSIYNDVKVLSGGIILNSANEVILESTISSLEYLNKLNKNHLVYFSRWIPSKGSFNKVVVLTNYLSKQYYHWNMESLGRLTLIEEVNLNDCIFILDQDSPKFVLESLEILFGIKKSQILLNPYTKIGAKEVIVPYFPITRNSVTQETNVYYSSVIRSLNLKSKLVTRVESKKRNIILSRSNATQRRIVNMEFIKSSFPNEKFEIVELEKMSFFDQIQLFRNANLIIASHGAGLVNLMYAEKPLVIEFYPATRYERDSFYFYQISSALEIVHCIYEYEPLNKVQDLVIRDKQIQEINQFINRNL